MTRYTLFVLMSCGFAAAAVAAGVKIAGAEFVPKDLIFAAAESKSQAAAEGPLPGDCHWSFATETRIGRREDEQRCVRFYFKTTIALTQNCPAKEEPPLRRLAERITATDNRCPDGAGRLTAPGTETRAISSGTTADGKQQEIVQQPDGTRVTLSYDGVAANAVAVFPDGTVDVLRVP